MDFLKNQLERFPVCKKDLMKISPLISRYDRSLNLTMNGNISRIIKNLENQFYQFNIKGFEEYVFTKTPETTSNRYGEQLPIFDYDIIRAYVWQKCRIIQISESLYMGYQIYIGQDGLLYIDDSIMKPITYHNIERTLCEVWGNTLIQNTWLKNPSRPRYQLSLFPIHVSLLKDPSRIYNVTKDYSGMNSGYAPAKENSRYNFITLFQDGSLTDEDMMYNIKMDNYNDFCDNHKTVKLVWRKVPMGINYNNEIYTIMFSDRYGQRFNDLDRFTVISMVDEYIMGTLRKLNHGSTYLYRAPGYPIMTDDRGLLDDVPRLQLLYKSSFIFAKVGKIATVKPPIDIETGKPFQSYWNRGGVPETSVSTLIVQEDNTMKRKVINMLEHYKTTPDFARIELLKDLKDYIIIKRV